MKSVILIVYLLFGVTAMWEDSSYVAKKDKNGRYIETETVIYSYTKRKHSKSKQIAVKTTVKQYYKKPPIVKVVVTKKVKGKKYVKKKKKKSKKRTNKI